MVLRRETPIPESYLSNLFASPSYGNEKRRRRADYLTRRQSIAAFLLFPSDNSIGASKKAACHL